MPNHLHGLLIIDEYPGRGEAAGVEQSFSVVRSDPAASPLPTLERGSIGAVVGNYKSLVARRINHLRRTPGGRVWQRGYYDRVVRDEGELDAVRRYIRDNPDRWAEDRDNLDGLIARMRPAP